MAAISFLNTAPLMWGLDAEPRLEIAYTVPSQCAEALRRGGADIGIIPVIEMARIADLAALPGIAIAARAEVRSILLISRRPAAQVRTLCLDRSSRTSSALAQILLAQRYGARFEVTEQAPDWRAMLDQSDAGLLIGDPALRISISGEAAAAGMLVYDLAAEWHQWTGLPFVFALWAVRRQRLAAEPAAGAAWLIERFQRAKREGLARVEELAALWAPRMGISPGEVRRYLQTDVEYDFTPEHRQGLERFFQLAAAQGLIPSPRPPAFLG